MTTRRARMELAEPGARARSDRASGRAAARSRDAVAATDGLATEGLAPVRTIRGRLASVSLRGTMGAGAWVGFALGLSTGALLGAVLAWLAGALVSWQRDLGFTLGVASRLLPLGDQTDLLREINARWYVTVPATALAIGIFGALVGALVAGILAAAYNRSPRHAVVEVELPEKPLREQDAG